MSDEIETKLAAARTRLILDKPFLGALVWSWGGYDLVLPGLSLLALTGLVLYLVAQKSATRV